MASHLSVDVTGAGGFTVTEERGESLGTLGVGGDGVGASDGAINNGSNDPILGPRRSRMLECEDASTCGASEPNGVEPTSVTRYPLVGTEPNAALSSRSAFEDAEPLKCTNCGFSAMLLLPELLGARAAEDNSSGSN